MKIIMPRVYLRWIDSASPSDSGWVTIESAEELEPVEIETVGFLFKETDIYYTVASSIHPGQASGLMTIPKVAVLEKLIYPDENDKIIKEKKNGTNKS